MNELYSILSLPYVLFYSFILGHMNCKIIKILSFKGKGSFRDLDFYFWYHNPNYDQYLNCWLRFYVRYHHLWIKNVNAYLLHQPHNYNNYSPVNTLLQIFLTISILIMIYVNINYLRRCCSFSKLPSTTDFRYTGSIKCDNRAPCTPKTFHRHILSEQDIVKSLSPWKQWD